MPRAKRTAAPSKKTPLLTPRGKLPAVAPPTPEERIEAIADIMARGEWITRVTARALAALWAPSVSFASIESYASQASKRVRASQGSRRRQLDEALSDLTRLQAVAEGQGDTRTAIRAVQAKVQILGPITLRVAGGNRRPGAPSGLPPELARLTPAPSAEEVAHFAAVEGPAACAVEGCRVHQKAALVPAAPEGPGLH